MRHSSCPTTTAGRAPTRSRPRRSRRRAAHLFNRIAYAAAHVVADPLRDDRPVGRPAVDWDATLAFRHHLWGLGFKIAEAMDTSQRGMGLDWAGAQELIRRSLAEARTVAGADLACGAGTDQLDAGDARTLDDVDRAPMRSRSAFVEAHGGRAIMMASRALAARARSRRTTIARVYGRILGQAKDKVILHWLGDMFDPQLAGYWGDATISRRAGHRARIIERHRRQGRRHQDLAARQRQGGGAARPPAGRRADVHRRRFQLCRTDRGRRRAATRTRCSASSMRSRRRPSRRSAALAAGDVAGFHAHHRADRAAVAEDLRGADRSTTRPASSSSPG